MCGVVGLIGSREAATEAFLGLTTLQHRGQDAAGILTLNSEDGFHRVKNIGLVESVFNRENMNSLTGRAAIGHVRYSTAGKGELFDVQPFLLSFPFGLGMIHNGNIVNTAQLTRELRVHSKRSLLTHSDTEIILNCFAEALAQEAEVSGQAERLSFDQICRAVSAIQARVEGSYSIVTLIADHGLVAFRDPRGIRPLVWGRRGQDYMVASESVALHFNGYTEDVKNIEPGEVVFIDFEGKAQSRILKQNPPAHCMFEWVYFASPESVVDGSPVYRARIELGRTLAAAVKSRMAEKNIQADIIVPIPETSRIAAIAMAEELKIPYREVLIKNRYIKRTFILDSQDKRQKAVNLKLSPVRSEIEGKTVILVDDSIVRGTTSKKIVELVRRSGAKQVVLVSTCPPIQHPCFYGIDFPEEKELVASGRNLEALEKELGVDALIYQSIDGLEQSLGQGHKLCMACLNGKYPVDVKEAKELASQRSTDRGRAGS